MKKVQWFLGIVFSLALILVLLINSFQFAAYGDFGFYEKEYKKYDVVSDLDMELKDVMYVTYEMMDYLIGDRENLDVYTVVEGKEQDFFNEQDKLHMAEFVSWWSYGKKSISGGDAALSFRTLGDKGELEKDSGKRISDRSWDRHSRSRVSGRSADCRF